MSRGAFNSRSLLSLPPHSRPSAVAPLTRDQSEQRNLVFPRILVVCPNYARVALAVESHREGTDLDRFFPTEAVRTWV